MFSPPQRGPAHTSGWLPFIASLVLLIGFLDYVTGFELSLALFYFVPVCLAVLQLGVTAGVVTAFGCVGVWLIGDVWAGAHYAGRFAPWWNALFALCTYLLVIWLLAGLLARQRGLLAIRRELEARVLQRTAALTEQIVERERLEKIVLETSERERRSIGRELHDGLGQHLTGTALAAQVLEAKLAERQATEATDARRLVGFIEQGIGQTRMLAKGLLLTEVTPDGFLIALAELAEETGRLPGLVCTLRSEGPGIFIESGAATHLFRIAQEAVRNAVRHANARNIEIGFAWSDTTWALSVKDDGDGLPAPAPGQAAQGLGLRIMAHRAGIVGAQFSIESSLGRGTCIRCQYPILHP